MEFIMSQDDNNTSAFKTIPNLFLLDPANEAFLMKVRPPFLTLNRSGIFALCLILTMLLPLFMLWTGISQLMTEFQLASSSVTIQAKVTNHRTVGTGGRGAATSYFITYGFTSADTHTFYVKEQSVMQDTFLNIHDGDLVTIKYSVSDPRVSVLAGKTTDNMVHNQAISWVIMGALGAVIVGIPTILQTVRFIDDRRLRHSGTLLVGYVNSCIGKLKVTGRSFDTNDYGSALRGNYFIEIYYRFSTPTNQEIRRHEWRKRNDLLNSPLPKADTSLAVLYLDDNHFKVL
jgi:hypothetical protein